MSEKRVSLYQRLPEIYRVKDEELEPAGQLAALLEPVEHIYEAVYQDIVDLYHDFFIETCEDWAIPYIGDLIGVSLLRGKAATLRADVADAVAVRRRKGTLAGLTLLVRNLTNWGVYPRELFQDLVGAQHLNHQRPDLGGRPPYAETDRFVSPRGGSINLRSPNLLSNLGSAFDTYPHTADLRPAATGKVRHNIPNLAVYLWRLKTYKLNFIKPKSEETHQREPAIDVVVFPKAAPFIARFKFSPLGYPEALFNSPETELDEATPLPAQPYEAPGPIPMARLSHNLPGTDPDYYVSIKTYDVDQVFPSDLVNGTKAIQLFLDRDTFAGRNWKIRGANLCAWESGLYPPLELDEIAIDPRIGRIVFGINSDPEGKNLADHLLACYHFAQPGPVGAVPDSRDAVPTEWGGEATIIRRINAHLNPTALSDALGDVDQLNAPLVIEIDDSLIHELDIGALPAHDSENGDDYLPLNRSLIIRAADNQRPIIQLAQPIRFRPRLVQGANAQEQELLDAQNAKLTVRFEGIFLTRAPGMTEPLVTRTALHALELAGCTLDPGGTKLHDNAATQRFRAMELSHQNGYGFNDPLDETAFKETPEILIHRCSLGSLHIDDGYYLDLKESILGFTYDAGGEAWSLSGAGANPGDTWGPVAGFTGVTVFGRARFTRLSGKGGIWMRPLEVLDNSNGCLKLSYFPEKGNRLPQNHGCVSGDEATPYFTSEVFGRPAFGQLKLSTDSRIRTRGPDDDAMGAFGFLFEAHAWRNLEIRFREFMPVGIRPILIPVT